MFQKLCFISIDIKRAFLNGYIMEKVYVKQLPGFISYNFPNHVFKLKKTLYELKQAPRAWNENLRNFFFGKWF